MRPTSLFCSVQEEIVVPYAAYLFVLFCSVQEEIVIPYAVYLFVLLCARGEKKNPLRGLPLCFALYKKIKICPLRGLHFYSALCKR